MIFSWPLFLKTFVIGEWLVNYTYINEFLCEKGFEKENKSKGCCHLNKIESKSEEVPLSSDKKRIVSVEFQNFLTVILQEDISPLTENRVLFFI
jgi:hypothetical protein